MAGLDEHIILKWLHVLSSTVLFGTGIGTAFQMWMAHLRGDVRAIVVVARNVVLADWLFTLPAGIVQPVSGVLLISATGIPPFSSWLVLTYGLYLLALACWLPVVWLQVRVSRIAAEAAAAGAALPAEYHRAMRLWFLLGWPAFIGLVVVFLLMIAKPDLW